MGRSGEVGQALTATVWELKGIGADAVPWGAVASGGDTWVVTSEYGGQGGSGRPPWGETKGKVEGCRTAVKPGRRVLWSGE